MNEVAYFNTTSTVTGDSVFLYDATNDRLGIGLSTLGNIDRNLHVETDDDILARFTSTDANAGIELADNSTGASEALAFQRTANTLGLNPNGGRVEVPGGGDFDVDGGVFHVDATNNRVGIGTDNPQDTLNVVGAAKAEYAVTLTNTGNLSMNRSNHAGEVILQGNAGTLTLPTATSTGELYTIVYNSTTAATVTMATTGAINLIKDTASATTYSWAATGAGDSLSIIWNGSAWVVIGK